MDSSNKQTNTQSILIEQFAHAKIVKEKKEFIYLPFVMDGRKGKALAKHRRTAKSSK